MKRLAISCSLLVPLTQAGLLSAQELPSLREFKEALSGVEAPAIRPAAAHAPEQAPEAASACAAMPLSGPIRLEGRAFTWAVTYDVIAGEKAQGVIKGESDGYSYTDARGTVVGKSQEKDMAEGTAVTVTGCSGERIGEIVRGDSGWDGERSFEVKDASGKTVAKTGEIGYLQGGFTLDSVSGAPVAAYKSEHWFLDRWSITPAPGSSVDARLAAMVLVYNHSADRRESTRRRHDRIGDRPDRPERDR